MGEGRKQYAEALYGLVPENRRQEVLDTFGTVLETLDREKDFSRLLSSHNVSLSEKRGAIDAVFGPLCAKTPHLLPFLKVVSDHHRMGELPKIYTAYRSLVYCDMGVKEGIAYSAERLSKAQLSSIEEAVGRKIGSKVSLLNITDSRLLGGVKVAIDGKVFDGSLSGRLANMRRQLHGGIPNED